LEDSVDATMIVIFAVWMVAVIVLAPILGAESRPAFLRPDRKPRPMTGPMQNDWGRPD
jgi:hypothetical protein